nr:MAG: hypothetical protein DIU60_02955 [Actinomycetota bacterium]
MVQERSAYSVERANLIVRHGFCTCPPVAKAEPEPAVRSGNEPENTGQTAPQPIVTEALQSVGAQQSG